tara:strand:+ start:46708 stop:47007 length:300 start_codon:yes stop_codon:yes gene_type:complete
MIQELNDSDYKYISGGFNNGVLASGLILTPLIAYITANIYTESRINQCIENSPNSTNVIANVLLTPIACVTLGATNGLLLGGLSGATTIGATFTLASLL